MAGKHWFYLLVDGSGLLRWISGLDSPPRRVFITHGEPDASQPFAELVGSRLGYETHVPSYLESVVLD